MSNTPEKRIEEIAESAGKLQLQEITFEEHMNLVEKLFTSHHQATLEGIREEVEKKEFQMNVDEYLPMVEKWNEKNFDVPFYHGYKKGKSDTLSIINSHMK